MSAKRSSTESADEDLHSDKEAERRAALLSDLPEHKPASDPKQSSNLQNVKTVANLLEYTALWNLFNKMHLNGLQLRGLPQEFTPSCITSILLTVKSLLCSEPSCLQMKGPTVLFGDLHGEYHILAKLADILGRPPLRSFLFLGDYVDRGVHSLETLLYLLLMKLLHPQHVFLLRGNHEDRRVYRYFTFEDDLIRTFGLAQGQNLSSLFHTVLCYLPVCAILNGEIFCCHGGLSPHFNHPRFASTQEDFVSRVNQLAKPVLFRRSDFVADLLWSDPLDLTDKQMPNLRPTASSVEEWLNWRMQSVEPPAQPAGGGGGGCRSQRRTQQTQMGQAVKDTSQEAQQKPAGSGAIDWVPNPRGCSYVFSKSALDEFMRRYKIHWLIRGHMYVSRGYQECFNGRCITLFSAADYAQRYHNTGAVIVIDDVSADGRDFPGRVMRYTKQSLLQFPGQLPSELTKWPKEIGTQSKK